MNRFFILLRELYSCHDFHFLAGVTLAFVYSSVFVFLAFRLVAKPQIRNFLTFSTALLFLLLTIMFGARAIWMSPWNDMKIEILWFVVALLPPVLFMISRKRSQLFGGANDATETARFNKLKDDFLTVASHELRTPLAVINGFAEILVREKVGPLNDEQKRRVRKILMQGQRLHHIIDDLLDLSRIRSGKIRVRKDVMDLVPVLKSCVDDHQILCDQQNIELVDKIPDVLPDVVGDLERVTQVVVNLCNNAVKYTDGGGSITLSAFLRKEEDQVQIEIVDSGIGIDKENQTHVFEEFYRAEHQRARKYAGSGLGLAIVKQLVNAMGGHVGVESEGLGKGTCFFFTLPVAKDPKQPLSKEAASAVPTGRQT